MVSQPVQFFLDVGAYEHRLLNEAERTKIRKFVESLEYYSSYKAE